MTRPELRDYQLGAVAHLHGAGPGAGLFMDMGLGKTACALTALTPEHLPALVVAPKRVAENVWDEEARLWRPDLRLRVAAGDPPKRERALTDPTADVVVLGRDNLRQAYLLGAEERFNTLILDELSSFKNHASARTKLARKMRKNFNAVWGLTGTPSPNGLLNLWSQVLLLDGGERLGTSIGRFRELYFTPAGRLPNGVVTGWDPRPGAAEKIHALIDDICLSMKTEGRLDLPPMTYNYVEVPLDPATRTIYRELKRDLASDVEEVLGWGELHTAGSAAIVTDKLSQVTAGFLYVDEADLRGGAYDVLHRNKINAVREIVEGTGSPVLVFYRYRAERELLAAELGDLAYTMDEPNLQRRWNAGEFPVLLAHPASAGHGLNLQHGGHTVVWTSLPWSLEEWEQGNKRLLRSGQQHPVIVHVLTSPRTVDAAIRARLLDKAEVQDALRDHLESPL